MDETPVITAQSAEPIEDAAGGPITPVVNGRTYMRNVFITSLRLAVFASIGLLLPSFLTHRLSSSVYGGWILILQIASYIGYLDFGVQTGVAKYIAQYAAASDHDACDQHASAGVAITFTSGLIGIVLSIAFAFLVPFFFKEMPPDIAHDVSNGVMLVGISTAILLASSAFGGIFIGLQRYSVPVFISIANKVVYASILVVMVLQHRSLTIMGISVAIANVVTAILQVGAWRVLIPHIHVRASLLAWPIVKRMLAYCAVLGIWTSGMLIITGLDTTIVGHFNFAETAFYAIAATPVSFISQVLHAALTPLMPAVSALSVSNSSGKMGEMLERTTRYTMVILEAAGLPLILFGFSLLSIWVGPEYAKHSLGLMRILVLAHIIRNICAPYSSMVLATGMQRVATASGVCEAMVNLVSSIVLGKFYGATGVAFGTLLGACVGVMLHFVVSMRKTQQNFAIHPFSLFQKGVLRPGIASLPTLILLPLFWRPFSVPFTLGIALAWGLVSAVIAWRAGLSIPERSQITFKLRGMIPGIAR